MFHKSNDFSLESQGVPNELYVNFKRTAYSKVKEGVKSSLSDFKNDPGQFEFRSAKAIWINSKVKKLFYSSVLFDNQLMKKVNHLKSHGVDYYSLDGKALICFKKMDERGRISGFYSKRFKEIMSGNIIHYSKVMLDNLYEMGINKPLPIYYIGHILDKTGNSLSDIRLVHYNNGGVAYEVSLEEIFKPNLFNLNGADLLDEIKVTSKRKNHNKKTGN
ncbi:hypothetical protein AM493_15150 [Flavobacterium akiainvivens]|uniref:Uncharacterized protein n=1 Tax=Flavobacterium akiainvivens TaxID=1202724 RepID=A0A0M8MAU1_9FLAO|nr:hypothetical protein [Flavobacterium akiainvivens]KOS07223.1 hypothetical protein AM493_15150 [Flavobacterium akiainvivens]SFQ45258.1 hypothetical protein SAMN05444144_10512 [Flavobacterium akiainvivens]